MTRVLHVGKFLPPVRGGMETAIYNICDALSETQDCVVRLVGSNTSNQYEEIQVRRNFYIAKLKTLGIFFSTPISTGIKKEIRDFNPDVVHLHLPNPWLELLLHIYYKGPLVVTYHCDVKSYPILILFYNWLLKHTFKKASRIIATSKSLITSSKILSLYKSKISVIHLSIHHQFPKMINPVTTQNIISKYGKKLILFVGRLVKYKGLDKFIPLVKDIDANFLIVGSGPEKEELMELVKKNNLTSKIHFVGDASSDDLPSYYNAAKLVVLPSIDEREALGMCLIEGLSCGRPLITTNLNTGVTEVNLNQVTGYAIDLKNSNQFIEKSNELLQNTEKWNELSKNAYNHYQNNFDMMKIGQDYLQIYKSVLK